MDQDHPSFPFVEFVVDRMQTKRPGAPWPGAGRHELEASFHWQAQELTLLCAEQPAGRADSVVPDAVPVRIQQLDGWLDDCSATAILAVFAQPGAALEMAMDLQRNSNTRYRIALATGSCLVATFECLGRSWRALIGGDVIAVEQLARRVPAGTVQLSPTTFALLEAHLDSKHFDGMVSAEFMDETVMEASITMSPHATAALSTFAGLGLT